FINTLPVRVDFSKHHNLESLLQYLHSNTAKSDEYSYLGLTEIQKLSPLASGQALFNTAVVFENYPLDVTADSLVTRLGLDISNFHTEQSTTFDITLIARQAQTLSLEIEH